MSLGPNCGLASAKSEKTVKVRNCAEQADQNLKSTTKFQCLVKCSALPFFAADALALLLTADASERSKK